MTTVTQTNEPDVVVGKVETLPAKQSESILSIIEKIALMPEGAAENIERMHAIHKDTLNREAEQAFNQDFVKAQIEMLNNSVIKNADNNQTKSKYATLEKIDRVIKPIYTRHGFGLIGGTEDSPIENHIRVTYDLIHKGGHSRHYTYDCPIDDKGIAGKVNKTPTHARGSSTTYGKRYLKCLIWDVITQEDDDGNAAGGSPSNIEKLDQWLLRVQEWEDADTITSAVMGTFFKKNETAIRRDLNRADAAKVNAAMKDAVKRLAAKEAK